MSISANRPTECGGISVKTHPLIKAIVGWLSRPRGMTWSGEDQAWITTKETANMEWTIIWKQKANGRWSDGESYSRSLRLKSTASTLS